MRETIAKGSDAATVLLGDIIAQLGADRTLAGEIPARAHTIGADPLVVLAHRLRVSLAAAYGAAADRLGFAHSAQISDLVTPTDFAPVALADFAGLRSLRARVGGVDILFAAPDFATLLTIAIARCQRPGARPDVHRAPGRP